jgi:PhnB protein
MLVTVMLAVPDAPAAAAWYRRALGATDLWSQGSVIGLEIHGAPFFVGQPENNGWATPATAGTTTTRIEVFDDDPDALIERAVRGGAVNPEPAQDRQMPWGTHRQGSFTDPFGHLWLVGDPSPLQISGGGGR